MFKLEDSQIPLISKVSTLIQAEHEQQIPTKKAWHGQRRFGGAQNKKRGRKKKKLALLNINNLAILI